VLVGLPVPAGPLGLPGPVGAVPLEPPVGRPETVVRPPVGRTGTVGMEIMVVVGDAVALLYQA